ncbi:MAG: sulfurtransferase [Anaerolineales bacterium]|nr:sulfurtransferase [Anaerolineales bacterium]
MTHSTFIDVETLFRHLDDLSWAIVDCRFDLTDDSIAENAYLEAHIPGAIYAHLERDLSTTPDGTNGRHPLPSIEEMTNLFGHWGIDESVQVIAYDARGGGFAARLWWSLRYLGHDAVAVLEGGLPAWERVGYPLRSGFESRSPKKFRPEVRAEMRIAAKDLLVNLGSKELRLIDSRAPERYRGEEEPYDPIAGHIPGALNHFWGANLDEEGNLLPQARLRAEFETLISGNDPNSVVFYCGSGVTACLNVLVTTHLGFEGARLYPGSWSAWCADPALPVTNGSEP